MKKIGIIIFLLLALALFPACAQMTGSGVNQPTAPVLDRIMQRGELVVGTSGE